MFGYIRPLRDELKVRDYDKYKACYCALCRTLKRRGTPLSSFILSYDFTFLAMLMYAPGATPGMSCARCAVSPIHKKPYCVSSPALDICADYSVILAWWKLRDSVRDEGLFKSLRDRAASWLLKPAYRKAAKARPSFEHTVREKLGELDALEKAETLSLDACADKFAAITAALAGEVPESQKRQMTQLLYHTGRYIYIVDAADDLSDDFKAGRLNPVAVRYGLSGGTLTDESRKAVETTLLHSCRLAAAAYELLDKNLWWEPVLTNIIYLGMPQICRSVLTGTWHNKTKGIKNEKEMSESL